MNILLDTHIAVWAISDHPKLPQKAKDLLIDPDNTIYYSSISTWEILLKTNSPRNNLDLLPDDFIKYCDEAGYYQLNLTSDHVVTASNLDLTNIDNEHKDPFDRILLAQAKTERFCFLTADNKLPLYNEKCVIKV